MIPVNFMAIVVSAIASMVIGSIWYGPLFGKLFMREMGMDAWTPEKKAAMKKSMAVTYILQFIASLVIFFIFAKIMGGLRIGTPLAGFKLAFWVWLGFIVPTKLGEALWGGKMSLFWIGAGNTLITMLTTGLIIGAWR